MPFEAPIQLGSQILRDRQLSIVQAIPKLFCELDTLFRAQMRKVKDGRTHEPKCASGKPDLQALID